MKKIKIISFTGLVLVLGLTYKLALAKEYDFMLTEKSYTKEDALHIKNEQEEKAKKFATNLDDCSFLEYSTKISTKDLFLDKLTLLTKKDLDKKIKELEDDNYKLNITTVYNDKDKSNYVFEVLNNKIISTVIADKETLEYNGMDINKVLETFENLEDSDKKIIIKKDKGNDEVKTNIKIVNSLSLSNELKSKLEEDGYSNIKVNKITNKKEKNITSRNILTIEEVKIKLEEENTKEIEISNFYNISKPNTKTFSNLQLDDANEKIKELEKSNLYESIEKIEKTDKTKENLISSKNKYSSNKEIEVPSKEAVYDDDNNEIGYRNYYYGEDEVVSKKDEVERNFLTEEECKKLSDEYKKKGYNTICNKTTNTYIKESTDNKFIFNTSKNVDRKWSHLDLSINQTVNFYNEDMDVVYSSTGTLSNVSAYLLRNDKKIDLVYSSNPSSDNGRLEYCQTNSTDGHCNNYSHSGNSFYLTNNDKIVISADITYKNKENKEIKKRITLEGYLNNIFNVCRQKNSVGGGFDLKLAISVDKNGNYIVNFTTEEVWSFSAVKEAVYKKSILYDEYRYATIYDVTAQDLDYIYNVEYNVNEYEVKYDEVKTKYYLTEEVLDKDYIIEGSKQESTTTTYGIVKKDNVCMTDNLVNVELDEIIPPHTGI